MRAKLILIGVTTTNLFCQAAAFQNLNFDNADLSNLHNSGGFIVSPATDMIPGWQLRRSGFLWTEIPYNNFPPGPWI
jgi:hypothetical protein